MDETASELSNSSRCTNQMELEDTIGNTTASLRHSSESSNNFDTTVTGSVTRSLRRSSSSENFGLAHDAPLNDVTPNQENTAVIAKTNSFNSTGSDHLAHIPSNLNDIGSPPTSLESNDMQNIEIENFHDSIDYYITDDEVLNSSEDEEDLVEVTDEIDNDMPLQFLKLANLLEKEESNETINTNFVVNKIEILLGILKFCKTYSLPNSAVADLCKMLNSFLDESIIPDTRYHIDKLFYPDEGTQYHATCPVCKTYVGKFNKQIVRLFCTICEEFINLKDPSYRDFFVTLDIRDEIKNIIENNDDYYSRVISQRQNAFNGDMKDIYNGQKYTNFIASLPDSRKDCYVTLNFNSDGSPIFKSSKFSIWPIQVIPNEVPIRVRTRKTITYSLWFGHDKPDMSYFLRPFVEDINNLSNNGIPCMIRNEKKEIFLYAICCCVDSVARAPMQGICQFNGYYGCTWCLHPGKRVAHTKGMAMKYTLLDEVPERRTPEETFLHMQRAANSRAPIFGVKRATSLLVLNNFDIIDGFVPDHMHCLDLGIAKQFAEYWFSSTNMPFSISKYHIDIIDKHIKAFKVPTQIARLSRSIYDRKFWKAKEWENWVLYYSLPILSEIPNFKNYLKHWSLLVEAYHLLLRDSITEIQLRKADNLLKTFTAMTEYYYTDDAMSYNIHQLIHLSQSVVDWGPLWAHSGYPFESGNGIIIRNVHAAKGVLSQICRNLSFTKSINILEKHIAAKDYSPVMDYCYYLENRSTKKCDKIGLIRYFGRQFKPNPTAIEQLNLSSDRVKAYCKIIKQKCVFKSSNKVLYRSDNSFAHLINGDYIQIEQFLIDTVNNIHYTVYKKVETEVFLENAVDSIKRVVQIRPAIYVIETKNIDKPCVYIQIHDKCYISSLPNVYYYS